MGRTITIDPITRLEGHGKIEIFLDDEGAVKDCYLQIPELRGFERFVVGRPIEELPRIVTRICGVCPASHHLASAKAVDGCFGGQVAPLAVKLRDMYYQAHFIHSHIAHFYALAAPDFVCGPDADPATRNMLGVVAKVGLEIGAGVIQARSKAQQIQQLIGGKRPTPSGACPAACPRAFRRRSWTRSGLSPTSCTSSACSPSGCSAGRSSRTRRTWSSSCTAPTPSTSRTWASWTRTTPPTSTTGGARGRLPGAELYATSRRSTSSTWPSTWSRGPT